MKYSFFKRYDFKAARIYDLPPSEGEIDWIIRVELYKSCEYTNCYIVRILRRDRFTINMQSKKQKIFWVEELCLWNTDNFICAEEDEEAFEVVEAYFNFRINCIPMPDRIKKKIKEWK